MNTFSNREGYSKLPIIHSEAPQWMRLDFLNSLILKYLNMVSDVQDFESEVLTYEHCYKNTFNYQGFYQHLCIEVGVEPDITKVIEGSINSKDYSSLKRTVFEVDWYKFYDIVEFLGNRLLSLDEIIHKMDIEEYYSLMMQSDEDQALVDDYDGAFEVEAMHREDELNRLRENINYESYMNAVNQIFLKHNIGWRLDESSKLKRSLPSELEDKAESIKLVFEADFPSVISSIRKAETYIYRRPLDAENSIKEIITALEAYGRSLYPNTRTLTEVIKKIKGENRYPEKLLDSLQEFYRYSCDESGVRHGKPELPDVSIEDAEFCFHVGLAFLNYLHSIKNS